LVQPTGALLWRFRYKILGVERKMSLGTFPDVSLWISVEAGSRQYHVY